MGDADRYAWAWYAAHATLFVQEFGLMPGLIGELEFAGMERDMFLARLNMIHSTITVVRNREMERRAREK